MTPIDSMTLSQSDDLLSPDVIAELYNALILAHHRLWCVPVDVTGRHQSFLQCELNPKDFISTKIHTILQEELRRRGHQGLRPTRVFSLAMRYGHPDYVHLDDENRTFFCSASVAANVEWLEDWGGELVAFDSDLEAQQAVSFKPGRIVFIGNQVRHRAGMPSRLARRTKVSLNVRFS